LVGICVGAAESKTGSYLVFFLCYALAISMTLGYAYIAQKSRDGMAQWDLADRVKVAGLLVMVATVVYLVLPRFPAGQLGAQPHSEHFYHNDDWERQAESTSQQVSQTANRQQVAQDLANQTQQGADAGKASTGAKREGNLGEYRYAGFSEEMDIENPDPKGDRFSNGLLAYVRADRPLYLRAQIFDVFDGQSWSKSSASTVKLRVPGKGLELYAGPDLGQVERYEVLVERNLGSYVAAAAVPVRLHFPGTVVGRDVFGQLKAPGNLKRGTAYSVESVLTVKQERLFSERAYQALPGYLQLPDEMDERIVELAKRVTAGTSTELEAAIALESHLRNEYDYSLESVFSSQGVTPLSEFLFETRYGHCEYFASALVVMLRSLDIPARLVTGFSATQKNPLTGYYEIYALDGHAWVEAYIDELGWMVLEPTAFYDGPMPEQSSLSAQQISSYVERQRKIREAVGEAPFTLANVLIAIWQAAALAVTVVLSYLKLAAVTGWRFLLVGAVLACICWYLLLQVRPYWQARCIYLRAQSASHNRGSAAIGHYLAAIDALLRLAGHERAPGQTIECFLQTLESFELNLDHYGMSETFNRVHYAYGEVGDAVDAEYYRLVLEHLYRSGLKRLRYHVNIQSSTPG